MRARPSAVLGALLAAFLLVWLVGRIEDRTLLLAAFSQAFRRPGSLVLGVALFGMALGCGTLRWVVLLRALDLPIGGRRALQLYAIGHFFNIAVPGSTGGDVVKATCAAMDCPGRRPEAVASILAERVVGMIALFVLVAFVAVLRPSFYQTSPELRILRLLVLLLGAGVAGGAALVFGFDWSRRMPSLSGARRWHRAAGLAVRAFQAIRHCAAHPGALATTFVLSFTNHVLTVACAWSLGRALGLDVRTADYLTVVPLVNAVSSVPITPGGAGIRETASTALLATVGASAAQATALSLLVYGVILFWALVGGLCYLVMRTSTRGASRPVQERARAAGHDSGTSRSRR